MHETDLSEVRVLNPDFSLLSPLLLLDPAWRRDQDGRY